MAIERTQRVDLRVTGITQQAPETHDLKMEWQLDSEEEERLVFHNNAQSGLIGLSIAIDDLRAVLQDVGYDVTGLVPSQ